MGLLRSLLSVLLVAVVTADLAVADPAIVVGTVAELDPSVEETLSDNRITVATAGKPVYEGSRLVTKNPGRLFVNFQDRWAAKLWENSELWLTTSLRTEQGYTFKHQLKLGQVRVLIKDGAKVNVTIATAVGTAVPRTTDFIVRYDGHTMTVIGLHGEVTFDSIPPRRDRRVVVKANQISSVVRGQSPTPPTTVDSHTMQQYVGGTVFIGGGALESQAIDHPSLDTATTPWVGREPFGPPVIPGEPYPPHDPSPSNPLQPVFVPLGGVGIQF